MDTALMAGIQESIFSGDLVAMENHTRKALEADVAPIVLIEQGLMPAMEKLGEQFGRGEVFLPELLIGADAMRTSLEIIKPLLKKDEIESKGTIVIGTVLGDVHDIGKNLVAWMMEGAGFNVIDLGVDVPPDRFIQAVNTHTPQILCLSALLTTSSPQIGRMIERLKAEGLRNKVIVMIGGASVNQSYADQIGADGYAEDAVRAVVKARELLGHVLAGGGS